MKQKGWFKIDRTSETGRDIEDVFRRKSIFCDLYNQFKEKYGIDQAMGSSDYLANIDSVSFIGKPDKSQWKPVSKASKYFVPIKGTQAAKDFAKLNRNAVARWEIDMILGSSTRFPEAGFDARFEHYIFIHLGRYSTYELSEDCLPISRKEYEKAVKCSKRFRLNDE